MEEELSLDNILGADEIDNLFLEDSVEDVADEQEPSEEGKEIKDNKEITTEVDAENLFDDEPESVGSEEDIQEKEDPDSKKSKSTSSNFYSSIAKALQEDGVFPDLDDDSVNNIKAPEDFVSLVEEHIKAQLDERQKRVDEALGLGVEPTEIRKYESTLEYLNSINDDTISDESDKGEELRKQLIYHDFINRGYSDDRAKREVTKSFNAGTDIEDAKEALTSNKEYFKSEYDSLIKESKERAKSIEEEKKAQSESIKKSLLEDKKVFGDISVDASTRQKVYDNISKPIYKDPKTGELYTAIQKYEKENKTDFIKNVGLLYTLTDGFKTLDKLVKTKVNKEMKKGIRELEHTLNNTSRTSGGSLKFITGVQDDSESFIGKEWNIDV